MATATEVYLAEFTSGRVTNRAVFTTKAAAWSWLGTQSSVGKTVTTSRVHHLELDPAFKPV